MKNLILFFAALFVFSSAANATPITPQQGAKFYQNCMSKPDPRLLPGTQAPFCQCTQKYMMQNLTYEDLQGLARNERPALNKMMINVYANCLEYPVHDDVYQVCQKEGVPAAQCQCLASNIGKYTATEAQRLLGSVLAKYPNAFEPLAAIKQTPEFEAQLDNIGRQCANGTTR